MHAKLVIVTKPIPKKTDSFYEIKTKDSEIEKLKDGPMAGGGDEHLSELDLLRAMANAKRLRGFRFNRLNTDINLGLSGVKCTLIESYTGSDTNGFIFELENQSDHKISIDLTKLSIEADTTTVLSQIDRNTLSKTGTEGSKTLLRVVAKTDSLNDILPIAPKDDK
jgi:hypothetical protein